MSDTLILGSATANGTVSVRGKDGQPLVELLGRDSEAVIGAGQKGRPGRLTMYNGAQQQTVNLLAGTARLEIGGGSVAGAVSVRGPDGQPQVEMLALANESVLGAGQKGKPGRVTLYNTAQQATINLAAISARVEVGGGNVAGAVSVRGKDGAPQAKLLALEGESVLGVGQKDRPGRLTMYNGVQQATINLTTTDARLQLGGWGVNGTLSVMGSDGSPLLELLGRTDEAVIGLGQKNRPGRITLYDGAGNGAVELSGSTGDITLFNADCAEEFDIAEAEEIDAGTVVVLDDEGRLRAADRPYDGRVAGVVSGAGCYKPALVLDRRDTDAERLPVALLGKVYCKVDAGHGPIGPGDLLTTSPTRGHAMKATDPSRGFGAVIGKALTGFREGTGLGQMLVMLR